MAATGTVAPNLVVISFECHDEILNTFIGKVLKIDATERNLLANIIIEARGVFDCRLDDPYLQNMPKRRTAVFGGEQLIKLNLCYFLIHLLRRHSTTLVVNKKTIHVDTMDGKYNSGDFRLFNQIVDYLEAHITTTVTLNQICSDNLIGRSKLQRIFKQISSLGVIEYFSHMKINAAKEMIRLGQLNFTQISEQLGYTSLHYFSRQFKQLTGMSPSEYENSIKAMAEGSFPVENT